MTERRTSPKKKAKELAKYLRAERPDYTYLKSVFRALRVELEVPVPRKEQRLLEVPNEEEIRRFYQAVWNCRKFADHARFTNIMANKALRKLYLLN